jgi:hypothetical protein
MKVVTVLMGTVPFLIAMYILWHVYNRVPSARLGLAKARGYLSIFGIFAVTTMYWFMARWQPEEFGLSIYQEYSAPWLLCLAIYVTSFVLTIWSYRIYKDYRPTSVAEGRSMAGW